ncbi:hypothetical protein [Planococcus donghaensis]|uniref:hypothetical protein n=1 Tax=Planococcus donghaensis TaxID=414778 RepID=UPI00373630C6
MGSAVFPAKKKKIEAMAKKYGTEMSWHVFKTNFKIDYPEDWELINAAFESYQKNTKRGKNHPMPHPDKYLKNLYTSFQQND